MKFLLILVSAREAEIKLHRECDNMTNNARLKWLVILLSIHHFDQFVLLILFASFTFIWDSDIFGFAFRREIISVRFGQPNKLKL